MITGIIEGTATSAAIILKRKDARENLIYVVTQLGMIIRGSDNEEVLDGVIERFLFRLGMIVFYVMDCFLEFSHTCMLRYPVCFVRTQYHYRVVVFDRKIKITK